MVEWIVTVCFLVALFLYVSRKRERGRTRSDFYLLKPISEDELGRWLALTDFEILNRFEPYQLSEMSTGVFQGVDFALFLLSGSVVEGQCLRQTVTAIKLKEAAAPFSKCEGGLWLECDGEALVIYQEKQSMTCGTPLELFLGRAMRALKVCT